MQVLEMIYNFWRVTPQIQMNEPSTAEVMVELESILLSAEFAGSDRLSRFLRFIIEHYLAGNLDRLKETVIGVEVFGRQPGYDPKIEPIVRIEARRLRSKLEQFYEAAGRNHAVHISVPKGGYVPEIKRLRVAVV